jgi:hypothetical protein
LIGQTADFSYSANDPDGSISSVDLTLRDDGATVFSGSKSSATGTFSPSVSLTQGDITAEFTATDDAGATTTETISKTLQDTKPEFSIQKPVNNKLQSSEDIQVDVDNFEDDSKPGENPIVNLKIDGTTKQSFTVEDTEDFFRTVTGKEGSQTLSVEMVENDGDTTTKTRTVEVDTTPPNVSIEKPVNDSRTNSTTGIPLKFTVSDSNLDTSSYEYRKDGGPLFSTGGNTTISYGSIGQHNITVFAEDTLGNKGQDTHTIQVDNLNSFTAEAKNSGSTLKNFTVTLDGPNKEISQTVNGSKFKVFTSDIPKGDVSATVQKQGFNTTTKELNSVSNSFDSDLSFSLPRSGLTVEVLDETTDSKILGPKEVIIRNNTETLNYYYGNTYVGQDFGTEVADGDLDSKTGFSSSFNNDEKKRNAQVAVSLGQSSSETIYVKHSFQNQDNINNAAHTTLKKVEAETEAGNFQTIYKNSVDNADNEGVTTTQINLDNSNGEYTGVLKVTGLVDSDDDYGTRDFNLYEVYANNLNNLDKQFPNYPTGNVEITVDDNFRDKYDSRTYNTNLDSKTKLNLDAYLLESDKSILVNIKTLDSEETTIKGASVNVNKQFGADTKLVTQSETSADGVASFNLNPNTQYEATAVKQGFEAVQTSFSAANYQFDPLLIQLANTGNFTSSTVWNNVDYKLTPDSNTVDSKGLQKFNYTVNDPEAGITSLGVIVRSNGSELKRKTVTGSPTGGTAVLEYNVSKSGLTQGQDLQVQAFFVKDSETFTLTRNYQVLQNVEAGPYSVQTVLNKFNSGTGNLTTSILALLVTLSIGTGVKSRLNNTGGGLVSLMVLGIFVYLGWFNSFLWILTLLALAGMYGRRG